MKKILWIVDGVGWGYDNIAKAIEKKLPNYQHVRIWKIRIGVVTKEGSGLVVEKDDGFQGRIDDVNADIIMSMNPMNKRFLKNKKRAILRFSGVRVLTGWQRY